MSLEPELLSIDGQTANSQADSNSQGEPNGQANGHPVTTSPEPKAKHPVTAHIEAKKAKSKKTGAPRGNRNRVTHGLRMPQAGLPKGASFINRICNEARRLIEKAVAEANGEIGVYAAACIQSAIRWERHAQLSARWLRLNCATFTPEQFLAYSREIARASSERDKCLEKLGLDKRATADVWATFDATRNVTSTSTTQQQQPDAQLDAQQPDGQEGTADA